MNERQREYFRKKLLDWKDDILKEAKETLQHLQDENQNHPDLADRASSETDRAIELQLLGYLTYDSAKAVFTRFDILALGRNWGRAEHNGEARPGKGPIGIAIQLAGGSPYDRVAPEFMKLQEYVTGA